MNKKKICLVVIFNHRYNQNVEKLQKIYGTKFSDIYYVVPFKTDEVPDYLLSNVIRVYESSFYFQGYIATTYDRLKDKGYDYFLFVGDDLILNPNINEKNFFEYSGISSEHCFIKYFVPIDEAGGVRPLRLYDTIRPFYFASGVEWKRELPSVDEALAILSEHGFDSSILRMTRKYRKRNKFFRSLKMLPFTALVFALTRFRRYPYPLFRGYSDAVGVPREAMEEFTYYCGVFAAMNVFVEIAIPTALLFSSTKIQQEKDIHLKGCEVWTVEDIDKIKAQYHSSVSELLAEFPKDTFYYHPVKLSQWTWDIEAS